VSPCSKNAGIGDLRYAEVATAKMRSVRQALQASETGQRHESILFGQVSRCRFQAEAAPHGDYRRGHRGNPLGDVMSSRASLLMRQSFEGA
jgi:hypothetical protein